MKYSILALLLPFLPGCIPAQIHSAEEISKFYKGICSDFFPDGLEILEYYSDPEEYTKYTSGETAPGHLANFSTVIHEAQHGYENQECGGTWECTGIYLGDGIHIAVMHGLVYDTRELDKVLPDADVYREEIFRYDPYIFSEDGLEISSHTDGIYGLLEEMNAYYLGARATLETWAWFEREYGYQDCDLWIDGPLTAPGDDFLALHQFRLFLAWYIENAKARHPKVYEDIMENGELRVAFTLLERRFEAKEREYRELIPVTVEKLRAAGANVSADEDGFIRKHWESEGLTYSTGSGTELDEANYCRELLAGSNWEKLLGEFRVKGVTEGNYR